MTRARSRRSLAALLAALPLAAAALLAALPLAAAAQEPGGAVSAAEDLLAVLKLRGKPCAGIARYERLAESDYLVTCSDGPRYRIRVSDADRIEIEER